MVDGGEVRGERREGSVGSTIVHLPSPYPTWALTLISISSTFYSAASLPTRLEVWTVK